MFAVTKWRNTKDETTLINTHTTAQKQTNKHTRQSWETVTTVGCI